MLRIFADWAQLAAAESLPPGDVPPSGDTHPGAVWAAASSSPEQRAEISLLREKQLLMIRFFSVTEPNEIWAEFENGVLTLSASDDLREMRQMDREMREMFRSLSRADQDRLTAMLLDELGLDFALETAEDRKKLTALLKRGKLRTESEYYRLIERLNDVEPDSLSPAERVLAGTMVSEFEARAITLRNK